MQRQMIILGIDPGTIKTGYGFITVTDAGISVLDYGCIKPPADWKLTDRYLIIHNAIGELIDKFHPDSIVIETQFVHKNVQSAIKLGMARGVAIIAAKQRGCAVFEYSPTKAKMAVVGNGHASKQQVQGMLKMLLQLQELPPEDAADALALAICHAQNVRMIELMPQEI